MHVHVVLCAAMADARHGHSDEHGDEHELVDGLSHGDSADPEAKKPNPFESADHDPDDWVTVKVRAGTRDRFDRWYRGQHPGWKTKLLPEKGPFSDEIFGIGLDQIEVMFPPVEMSLAERIAKARAAK